jgi:hypothetical protein
MSSEAQIKANRENAQKSTGPRSAEGKAAVAKNAVKHGLFASETVIQGENAEDFEVFRDEMLNELVPVGPVESMLAERFVSLSWRLKRVQRMQDQVIDVMIEQDAPSPYAKLAQSMLPKHIRELKESDTRGTGPELVLGRAVIADYSNSRVLDRLSMYERRIENSMFKTLNELERRRLMREMKQADDGAQKADDGDSTDKVDFKKQSQSDKKRIREVHTGKVNVSSTIGVNYENKRRPTRRESNPSIPKQVRDIGIGRAKQNKVKKVTKVS